MKIESIGNNELLQAEFICKTNFHENVLFLHYFTIFYQPISEAFVFTSICE